MHKKRVSLSNELHILMRAVDATRLLAERWADSVTGVEDATLPQAIASNLVAARERMRLLDRAVRDTIDPATIWCPENDALPPHEEPTVEDIDVVLAAWSDKKQARRYKRAWKGAKRRSQRKQQE